MKNLTIVFFAFSSIFLGLTSQARMTCEIEHFNRVYSGTGRSETEARVQTRLNCAKIENTMFCKFKDMTCTNESRRPLYYCEFDNFGKLDYAFGSDEAQAFNDARLECLKRNNAMFCERNDVSCYSW